MEGMIPVDEFNNDDELAKLKVGSKLPVLLEKIEDKNGEVIVSAIKAQKIKGWYKLEEAYEANESIIGKITSKCKGGVIVEHSETGSLMFCPGSQISDKPLKNIDHLIGVEQKFAIIKLNLNSKRKLLQLLLFPVKMMLLNIKIIQKFQI